MNRTYLRLVRYFIFLMMITCLASLALFFVTIGYPASKDFHQLLRNHALFISEIAGEKIDKGSALPEIKQFLQQTAQHYGIEVFLFDSRASLIAASALDGGTAPVITQKMQADLMAEGIFVQPSHFGRSLIYVLPVHSSTGEYFLQIRKANTRSKRALVFVSGLLLLLALLVLAVYPLAKSFTKPLTQLTRAVKDVSEGNFKPETPSVVRNDELGELLQAFTDMAGSVDRMVESRKILLADISHELRSPLGRLNIAAELLKSEVEQNEKAASLERHVGNIEYEIQTMDLLLKQLSDWAVLNLPDTRMALEALNIADMLDEIFILHQPSVEKKGVRFLLETDSQHAIIMADRAKLVQVFSNLIDNACHYCPEGGYIKIGLKVSDRRVTCSVSNTGPEIPSHLTEKIFDPLFRVDTSRNRKTGGAGLGLAISKKIMEHHGAAISCHREGNRTVFSLEFERTEKFPG